MLTKQRTIRIFPSCWQRPKQHVQPDAAPTLAAKPQIPDFLRKMCPTPGVKLDIPENPQVGACSGCGLHNKNNIGPWQSVPAAATAFYGDGGDKYSQECWEISPPQQPNAFRGGSQWALEPGMQVNPGFLLYFYPGCATCV